MEISSLELLFGENVCVDGVCELRQIKLSELIHNEDMTYYNHALRIISMGFSDMLQIIGLDVEQFLKLPEEQRTNMTYFSILQIIPELRDEVCNALRYFIIGAIEFDEQLGCFSISKDDGELCGVIDEDSIETVRNAILQVNFMKESSSPTKFKSEKAKAIYLKCQAGKAKLLASKKREGDISIENVISFVSARSNSYNLFNISGLTIYQLYKEFTELNKLTQIDVIARRWATWGEDDFDWSVYYSSPSK